MERLLTGRPVVPGSAEGAALISREPLSFWGGLCPHTGEIIDRRHERSGAVVTGRVFVFPQGRGSSTSSATFMESIKAGVAPAAIINLKVDPILALGSIKLCPSWSWQKKTFTPSEKMIILLLNRTGQ